MKLCSLTRTFPVKPTQNAYCAPMA